MNPIGMQIVRRYEIGDLISENHVISVYKGMDIIINMPVLIKLFKLESETERLENVIRFQKIITELSKLLHPNILGIIGYYMINEPMLPFKHCVVMNYSQGRTLKEAFSEMSFSINETCEIICQICRALEIIHNIGVMHGEINPENFILEETGSNIINLKLTDIAFFRIKKDDDKWESGDIKRWIYRPPEQSGIIRENIDERSDLYSAGIIFYELLTGCLPFDDESMIKVLHAQAAKIPDKPSSINTDIPSILDDIILKLLEKDPDHRYQTATGLLHDLEIFLSGRHDFKIALADIRAHIDYSASLIGRNAEYSRLIEMTDEMRGGNGRICCISGEAGIGKTRLVDALKKKHIMPNGILYIEGRASDRENKIPYGPFRDALSDYMEKFQRFSENRKNRISEIVNRECRLLGKLIIDFHPYTEALFGDCPEVISLGNEERESQRFYITISKFMFCLAEDDENGKGLVIILDDLHWSDKGTLRILEEMTHCISSKPVLIIALFRESELPEDHTLHRLISGSESSIIDKIELKNLNSDEVSRYIDSVIKMSGVNLTVISSILFRKGGGNPLFTQEILKELIAEGVLVKRSILWDLDSKKISSFNIPGTVLDTVLDRIKNLSIEDIDFLMLASSFGKSFDIDFLIKLELKIRSRKNTDCRHHMHALVGIVDRALENQILEKESGTGRYSFVHDRVRDAFYNQITARGKKRMHARIAAAIEESMGMNAEECIFDLAYHYIESDDKDKILEYAYPAAIRARINHSNEDAVKYFSVSRDVLREYKNTDPCKKDKWIECTRNLGEVYNIIGAFDESLNLFRELLPYMKAPGEKAFIYLLMTRTYMKKWDLVSVESLSREGLLLMGENIPSHKISVFAGTIKEFIVHLLQLLFTLRTPGKSADLEKYRIIMGFYECLYWVYFFSNILRVGNIVLRMLNLSSARIGLSHEHAVSMMQYGIMLKIAINSLKKRGNFYIEKAYKMFLELKDDRGIGYFHWTRSLINMYECKYDQVIGSYDVSREILERFGDVLELIKLYHHQFMTHFFLSNYKEAYKYYLSGKKYITDVSQEIGFFTYGYPSQYYIETGNYAGAEEDLLKYFNFCSEKKIWYNYSLTCIYFCYLYIEKGEPEKAFKYAEYARELIEGNSFPSYVINIYYVRYAQLLICDYQKKQNELFGKERVRYRKKIKKACHTALKKTKLWIYDYCVALRQCGNYYALCDNSRKACMYYEKSIDICRKIGRRYELARGLFEYGMFLNRSGREAAWDKLTSAHLLFDEIGVTVYRDRIAAILGFSTDCRVAEDNVSRNRMQYVIDKSINFTKYCDLQELLDAVLSLAMEASGARNGYIFLKDDENSKLNLMSENHVNYAESADFSMEMITEAYDKEKIIYSVSNDNIDIDTGIESRDGNIRSNRSIICIPITHNNIRGICYLDNPLAGNLFSDDIRRILSLIFMNGAIIIENLTLHRLLNNKNTVENGRLPLSDKKYLEKAFEYIERNISEDISREEIASALRINPDYLGRLFKSNTGKSLQEYVNEVHVKKAAEQLANSEEKIIDIAMNAGFNSMRSFYRIFYRIMGVTPSEYRNRITGKEELAPSGKK